MSELSRDQIELDLRRKQVQAGTNDLRVTVDYAFNALCLLNIDEAEKVAGKLTEKVVDIKHEINTQMEEMMKGDI